MSVGSARRRVYFVALLDASIAVVLAFASVQPSTLAHATGPLAPRTLSPSRVMVLDVGSPGSADSVYARSPFVLKDTDGTYKMWYSGYDGSRNRGMYATSPDGIHWTKHGVIMDVLTAPYYFDSVGTMHVIKEGMTYEGWFQAGYWSGGAYGYWAQIYHATSLDGVSWNVTGVALPPNQSWDLGMTNNPWVFQDSHGIYWMYFFGWDGTNTRLGVATSVNGTWFTPYAGNPIIPLGASGAWDSKDLYTAAVVPSSSGWTMYYDGWDGNASRIGLADSADGQTWTKDIANPVYEAEPFPAWDDRSVSSPDPLIVGGGLSIYFVGSNATYQRIGVMGASPPSSGTASIIQTFPLTDLLLVVGFVGGGVAVLGAATVVALRSSRRRT